MVHSRDPGVVRRLAVLDCGAMPDVHSASVVVVLVFGAAGAFAGSAARGLLGRLPRGTSVRWGSCEVGVGVLWALVGWRWADGSLPFWWLPVPVMLCWLAVPLVVTDLRHRRLPDALTLPAYPGAAIVLAAAAALGGGWHLLAGAALGAVALFGLYAAVHQLCPGALGLGDVKLSGSLGATLGALGWPSLVLATWLAAVLTLLLRVLAPRRISRRWAEGIPHGPGLLAATCMVALFAS
jgi:leader peptidase (prepilin peptidase)/N-methyltransferase